MDLNTVSLTGRLGDNIELRETTGGKSVGEVNLAVDAGFGDNKKTIWIGLVMWGKTAEAAAQYLSRGRRIAVSGRLDQDEWRDKESGQQRRKTRVVVNEWTFADSEKKAAGESRSQELPPAGRYEKAAAVHGGEAPIQDDDIPFAQFEKHSPLPL